MDVMWYLIVLYISWKISYIEQFFIYLLDIKRNVYLSLLPIFEIYFNYRFIYIIWIINLLSKNDLRLVGRLNS
jgi:hypothetical protein